MICLPKLYSFQMRFFEVSKERDESVFQSASFCNLFGTTTTSFPGSLLRKDPGDEVGVEFF